MDISWTWLVVGLVLGVPLGLVVAGTWVEDKVRDARNEGYKRGSKIANAIALAGMRAQERRWLQRKAQWEANEQKWVNTTLELDKEVEQLRAIVEKFNPSKILNSWHECSPEIEETLAAVDLGKGV